MRKAVKFKGLLFALVMLICALPLSAQTTIEELNEEIRRAEKEIAEGEELLSKINQDQSVNSQQIKLLQSRINNRNSIIRSLESQISLTNRDISSRERNITQLEAELAQIKKEYGDMVYTSYKNHKLNNSLLFLFSSRDFNDMTRRLDYMRRYNAMREEKARDIDTLRNQLSAEVEQLTIQSAVHGVGRFVGFEVQATTCNLPCHPLCTEICREYAIIVVVLVTCQTHEIVVAPAFVSCFERHFVGDERFDSIDLVSQVCRNDGFVHRQLYVVRAIDH